MHDFISSMGVTMRQRIREAVSRIAKTDDALVPTLPFFEKLLLPILSLASVLHHCGLLTPSRHVARSLAVSSVLQNLSFCLLVRGLGGWSGPGFWVQGLWALLSFHVEQTVTFSVVHIRETVEHMVLDCAGFCDLPLWGRPRVPSVALLRTLTLVSLFGCWAAP